MTRDRHLGSWVTTAQLPVCNRDRPVRRGHTDPSAPDAESSRTMVRRRRRVADLGFCTPSRTRTGNPLRIAGQILAFLGIVLIWPLTCLFAARLALALGLRFGLFRSDGSGINRGARAALAAGAFVSWSDTMARAPPTTWLPTGNRC